MAQFNPVDAWLHMQAQLPRLAIQDIGLKYIYPILVGFLVLEYLRAKHLYDLKETLASFGIAAGATIMRLITNVFEITLYFFIFQLAEPIREQYLGYGSLGFAWYIWLACIIGDDHNFYWHHRFSHTVRLLWAAHLPHHSARSFNLTVSIRNGWFVTLYKPIFWLWMPLVGFEPIMIATCLIINSFYQFFLHSQLVPSFPWYEKVFNTPYVHTVHHSSNIPYMDRNHGGILIIWDRLYGTWQAPIEGVKPDFGITSDLGTDNPITHNLYEFQNIWKDVRKAPGFRNKFMYVFGPPGWSHDGSRKTAKQLQAELTRDQEQGSDRLE